MSAFEDNTLSLAEFREMATLADCICRNLKVIEESTIDLDELEKQTANIVANLKAIEESPLDLDELENS